VTDASPSNATAQKESSTNSASLDTEIVRADGATISEARRVSSEQIKRAQSIITQAVGKDTVIQMDAIDEAIASLYPYKPKPGQREALHHLIYSRKDLILIAGTGFGKSMILQAVSLLIQRSITLVILPLNQVGDEQCEFIRQIGGLPCFLNSETIGPKLLNEVQQGCFTHVLISPELAINDDFRPIASLPSFKQQVSLVVVDEAHLVYHWGRAFRTVYSSKSVAKLVRQSNTLVCVLRHFGSSNPLNRLKRVLVSNRILKYNKCQLIVLNFYSGLVGFREEQDSKHCNSYLQLMRKTWSRSMRHLARYQKQSSSLRPEKMRIEQQMNVKIGCWTLSPSITPITNWSGH
jgi:DEAD/DEAH box helicase